MKYRCLTCLLVDFEGTKRERGLPDRDHEDVSDNFLASLVLYDLPFGLTSFFSSWSWVRYVPVCPWRDRDTDGRTEDNSVMLSSHGEIVEMR